MLEGKKEKDRRLLTKYFLVSLFVLFLAVLIASVISICLSAAYKDAMQADHIVGMLEGIVGAVAAGLLLYQLKAAEDAEKHQNDISEASFILQFNQSFIQDANMTEVERLLEDQAYYDTESREIIDTDNRQKFINYLVYLESMAPLIINRVLKLENIDNLLAYRFFLAVENRELQDKEIIPYANYYRGCIKLYRVWKEYRKQHGLKNPADDCNNKAAMRELSAWEEYDKYLSA